MKSNMYICVKAVPWYLSVISSKAPTENKLIYMEYLHIKLISYTLNHISIAYDTSYGANV